jgi:Fur family peroxide stress response transcriptional regulator
MASSSSDPRKSSSGGQFQLSADDAERVRAQLEAVGCRYTEQRAAVYAYLQTVDSHPTAEEVYEAVRSDQPRISLATVYKALEALAESQLANKLTYGDGSARFDCRPESHYHFRDTQTGEVRDLPASFDPQLLAKLDPKLEERLAGEGFRVTGYRLEVLGHFDKPPAES